MYSLDDAPINVENSTIWVSEKLRNVTGAQPGDIVRPTTDIGNVYQFTLAGYYKLPYAANFRWYIVSDADYEYLKDGFFITMDVYGVKLDEMSYMNFKELDEALLKDTTASCLSLDAQSSDEYVLGYILSVFISLIGLFLILIVVMTIRFTMIAALKEEECEIGVLRAIGADSFSFRWLFAEKYIAFAVIGGALGIVAGLPLSKYVLSMFGPGNIMPSDAEIVVIGILSVLFIIALIIGFSMLVMRRINKISVVDAIRGENRAERFGRGGGIRLHKRRIMSPAFFIALSDILGRFKRYAFLLVAYTLGVLIILFVVNIKNSVINPEFLKYSLTYQTDFFIELSDEKLNDYIKRMSAENKNINEMINNDIRKAGIKAHYDNDHYNSMGILMQNGLEINSTVWSGSGDISQLSYHEGSVPVKENEAAMSWSSANSLGIQLGDEITLKMSIDPEKDGIYEESKEKFKITAFINAMDSGVPIVVLSQKYDKNPNGSMSYWATIIDADGSEKEEQFRRLEEMFGPEQVLDSMEYTKLCLAEYSQIFDLLELVMGVAVLFILMLMTYLYSSIFIAEEMPETALQKSLGFTNGAVKASHIFRILILSVVSVIVGEILLQTAGQFIVRVLMESLGITNFSLMPEFIMSFALIPALIMGAVLITEWFTLGKIKKADIRNIKDV